MARGIGCCRMFVLCPSCSKLVWPAPIRQRMRICYSFYLHILLSLLCNTYHACYSAAGAVELGRSRWHTQAFDAHTRSAQAPLRAYPTHMTCILMVQRHDAISRIGPTQHQLGLQFEHANIHNTYMPILAAHERLRVFCHHVRARSPRLIAWHSPGIPVHTCVSTGIVSTITSMQYAPTMPPLCLSFTKVCTDMLPIADVSPAKYVRTCPVLSAPCVLVTKVSVRKDMYAYTTRCDNASSPPRALQPLRMRICRSRVSQNCSTAGAARES